MAKMELRPRTVRRRCRCACQRWGKPREGYRLGHRFRAIRVHRGLPNQERVHGGGGSVTDMRQKNSGFALDSDDGLMLESERTTECVAGEIESLADVSAWRFPDAGALVQGWVPTGSVGLASIKRMMAYA